MINIKIAIVDDLKRDSDRLKECIGEFYKVNNLSLPQIDVFSSAEEFSPVFEPEKYDLVFLDILMNEMNGIELAQELRAKDPHLMIVFQTTERSYAFDAFPIHPFDYLIKPCRQDEVDTVLQEALRVLEAGDPVIEIKAVRASYSVPLRSIIAVTSKGHNVEISLTNKQVLTCRDTFKSIADKLDGDPRFLLINRGVVINMDYAVAPREDGMEMKDDNIYPIRVNGKAAVLTEFSQYMISKVDKRR